MTRKTSGIKQRMSNLDTETIKRHCNMALARRGLHTNTISEQIQASYMEGKRK